MAVARSRDRQSGGNWGSCARAVCDAASGRRCRHELSLRLQSRRSSQPRPAAPLRRPTARLPSQVGKEVAAMFRFYRLFFLLLALCIPASLHAADGNRLAYLDETDPYYVHRNFPKLITPQVVA